VEDRTASPPKALVRTEEDPDGRAGVDASPSGSNASAQPTVRELMGTEGGLWCVLTEGSSHYFDLDRGTVVRVPGPGAPPLLGDRVRLLRGIESCRVDSSGCWTLEADPWDQVNDYLLHTSSVIQEIRPISSVGPECERISAIDSPAPVVGIPAALSSAESLVEDRQPSRESSSDVAEL
jgi:hypothetical protein